jgi:hypothetical protein
MKVSTTPELSLQCALPRGALLKGRQECERKPEAPDMPLIEHSQGQYDRKEEVSLLPTYCKKLYTERKDPIILKYFKTLGH